MSCIGPWRDRHISRHHRGRQQSSRRRWGGSAMLSDTIEAATSPRVSASRSSRTRNRTAASRISAIGEDSPLPLRGSSASDPAPPTSDNPDSIAAWGGCGSLDRRWSRGVRRGAGTCGSSPETQPVQRHEFDAVGEGRPGLEVRRDAPCVSIGGLVGRHTREACPRLHVAKRQGANVAVLGRVGAADEGGDAMTDVDAVAEVRGATTDPTARADASEAPSPVSASMGCPEGAPRLNRWKKWRMGFPGPSSSSQADSRWRRRLASATEFPTMLHRSASSAMEGTHTSVNRFQRGAGRARASQNPRPGSWWW